MQILEKPKIKRFIKIVKWLFSQGKAIIVPIIIVTLIGTFASLIGVSMAIISKSMVDAAVAKDIHKVFFMAFIFGSTIIVQMALDSLSSVLSVKSGEIVANNMRLRLFKHWTNADWTKISKYHSGDVLTRMTSDVGTVTGGLIGLLPSIIALLVKLIAAFATLMFFEPKLAIFTFILTPAAILFSKVFAGRLGRLHKRIQETESKYRSYINEAVQNIMIIKVFGLGNYSSNHINDLQNKRMYYVVKRNWLGIITSSIVELGYLVGYSVAFIWSVISLTTGAITFGTMTAFLQLVGQIQSPFMGLAKSLPQMIAVAVSAERLMELADLELEESKNDDENVSCVKAGISFEDVSFRYDLEKNILNKVSFKINEGEIIGLIGQSGEGKTTIIRMLLALIKPISGKVSFTLDQINEIEVSAATREMISYVPQGNTLFSGTVEENIRIGRLDATEAELKSAAKDACALEFIDTFPEGFNTIIGERGYGLSEGQAQRIAIARAIIRNSPILILDEATSSLDSETEIKVLEAIKNLEPNRTCIVVTHRKSALSICNRAIKLENGNIYEAKV